MGWENNFTLNKSREYPGCSVLDRNTFKGSLKTRLLSAHRAPRTDIGTGSLCPTCLLHLLRAPLTCSPAPPTDPSSSSIPPAHPPAGSHPSVLCRSLFSPLMEPLHWKKEILRGDFQLFLILTQAETQH